MPDHQPVVVDLEMSVEEYLELLTQGIDPVKKHRDKSYELALLSYGVSETQARRVAPLMDKGDCTIEEKILVNQTLRHIWQQLIEPLQAA